MADQYRTVDIPTVGSVDFPSSMSDDDVATAIKKTYPQLNKAQEQSPATANISAYSPSWGERVLGTLRNSAIGHAIEQIFPHAPGWMKPTTRSGIPEAAQEKTQLITPEHLIQGLTQEQTRGLGPGIIAATAPAAPWMMLAPLLKMGSRENPASAPSATESRLTGVAQAAGGLTSGTNLSLAALPIGEIGGAFGEIGEKIIPKLASAGFSAQMIRGLAQQYNQWHQAKAAGDEETARQIEGSGALNSVFAALGITHAVTGWRTPRVGQTEIPAKQPEPIEVSKSPTTESLVVTPTATIESPWKAMQELTQKLSKPTEKPISVEVTSTTEPKIESTQTSPRQAPNPSVSSQENVIAPKPSTVPETIQSLPKPKSSVNKAKMLEGQFRPVVQTMLHISQLSKAATDRLTVEKTLRNVAGAPFTPEELVEYKKLGWTPESSASENDNPIVNSKESYNKLPVDDKQTIDDISRILKVSPSSLEESNWRLTDNQVKRLKDMKSEGLKPKKEISNAISEPVHTELADINKDNVAAAGIPNAKDLWSQASEEDKATRDRQKALAENAGEALRMNTSTEKARAAANTEFENLGLTVHGQKEAELSGLVSTGGKDIDTLEFEHDAMQRVLQKRLEQGRAYLQERIPQWEQARSGTSKPSPLAQEIASLDPSLKEILPKELYSAKHTGAETSETTKSTSPEESIQTTTPTAKATGSQTAIGSGQDVIDKIKDLSVEIQEKHGKEAFGALPEIFDAVNEKFKTPENVNKVLYGTMKKYKTYLDKGVEEPLKKALADTIDKLKPEKGDQSTLYSNPLQVVWNKLFGKRQTAMTPQSMPGPLKLSESPLSKFTEELQKQKPPSNQEALEQFFKNETNKVKDFIDSVPQLTRDTLQKLNEFRKDAWEAYTNRPGLNPLESALGFRRLQLTQDSIVAHRFVEDIMKLHPDPSRREAMVNYLQASGGVMSDQAVAGMLRQKADAFDSSLNPKLERFSPSQLQKLKKGYLDAGNLTSEEKKTVELYRAYDQELQKAESDAGLELHARENYIRQIWDKDSLARKRIDAIFASGPFATTSSFMKLRTFEDYFEGEQEGLNPHRKDFAYLVSARARASAEVLANRSLIEHLYDERMPDGSKLAEVQGIGVTQTPDPSATDKKGALLIKQAKPKDAITADDRPYVVINHPAFQNWKWVGTTRDGTTVLYKGSMLVHPDVAEQLRNILEPSAVRKSAIGKAVLGASSIGKQTLLIGLFHPIQLAVHFSEHLAEGGVNNTQAIKALNPFADSVINLKDTKQQALVMHGLKLLDFDAESLWDEGVMSKGFAAGSPFVGGFLRSMHDAMFNKYIPNMKMAMAIDALERNMDRYHDKYTQQQLAKLGNTQAAYGEASLAAQSQIYRMTADQMNSAFGGINWDHLPVNKTWRDVARLTVLAPDFLLARMQFVGDALRPGGRESLKALLVGAFLQYTLARALNAGVNDGDAKWSIQDWNRFVVGHHSYSLRTVQGDLVDSVMDPRRFWSHRMNPVTLRPLTELATGKDVFGHPASAGQQLLDYAKNIVPMPLQGAYDTLVGATDPSKRVGKHDEQIADTIVQSMFGVQRKQYRTPAENYVFREFDNISGGPTSDELALEQKNTFIRLRDSYREGKLTPKMLTEALNNPKANLKASEVSYLFRTANKTELVNRAQHLEYNQVHQAWNKADGMEKMELAPVLMSKVKSLAFPLQRQAYKELSDYQRSLSPEVRKKLSGEIQDQIGWENRK